MRIKSLILVSMLSLGLVACNNSQKVVNENNENIEVTTVVEAEVTTEIEKVASEVDNLKIDSKLENSIDIDFHDNWDPGTQYTYNIDTANRILNYRIFYESSIAQIDTDLIIGEVVIENEDIWNKLVDVLQTNILEEDTENIFGYKYHELVNLLCFTLEDISTFVDNDIMYKKSDMSETTWNMLYIDSDIDNNGEVTSYEDIMYSLNIILDDLNNY